MRRESAAIWTLLSIVIPLAPLLFVTACREPAPEPTVETGLPHDREHSFTLAPDGYPSVFGVKKDGSYTVRLPRLRVFDREGSLLLDLKSYRTDLPALLQKAAKEPGPVKEGRTLSEELSQLWTSARKAPVLSDLGEADLFIVTYEAEWCVPCKAQLKDARGFARANPALRIDLIRVDVNTKAFEPAQRTGVERCHPLCPASIRQSIPAAV